MELREIEAFLTVAKELHFGRAALILGITQGRVSQMIQALEKEVGGSLLERTSRRVRLTVLGEQFHDGIQYGYQTLADTMTRCQSVARRIAGRLRIGYFPSIGGSILTRAIETFANDHPRCEIILNVISTGDTLNPAALLGDQGMDVVLTWSPGGSGQALQAKGLAIGPVIATERRGVLVPDHHPLARHVALGLEDLVEYEMLRLPETQHTTISDLWTPRFAPSGRPLAHTIANLSQLTGRSHILVHDVLPLVCRDPVRVT